MDELEKMIRPTTILVSVMTVNNEIGVIQDIKNIAKLVHSKGAYFHTDAVQAVPYIDVKFISQRQPTDGGGRLNALSIFKFLEGAVNISNAGANSSIKALVAANTSTGPTDNETGARSSGVLHTAGVELFTTPQTLINANVNREGSDSTSLRAVPVIDPMRPFLSLSGNLK